MLNILQMKKKGSNIQTLLNVQRWTLIKENVECKKHTDIQNSL
jgi:hypothetical protein